MSFFFFNLKNVAVLKEKKKSAHNAKLYDNLIDAFQNVKYDICKHYRSYSDRTIFCFIFTSINYILNYEQLSAMTAVTAIFFSFSAQSCLEVRFKTPTSTAFSEMSFSFIEKWITVLHIILYNKSTCIFYMFANKDELKNVPENNLFGVKNRLNNLKRQLKIL